MQIKTVYSSTKRITRSNGRLAQASDLLVLLKYLAHTELLSVINNQRH